MRRSCQKRFGGDYALPILKTLVPQFGHTPRVAGLPFFMVYGRGSFISTILLSVMQ